MNLTGNIIIYRFSQFSLLGLFFIETGKVFLEKNPIRHNFLILLSLVFLYFFIFSAIAQNNYNFQV